MDAGAPESPAVIAPRTNCMTCIGTLETINTGRLSVISTVSPFPGVTERAIPPSIITFPLPEPDVIVNEYPELLFSGIEASV